MRDVLLTLVVVAGLPFIVQRPAIGILYWIWLGLMNPQRLAWGFAYSLQFSQIVAIATVIGVLFTREPRQMKGGAAAWVLFAFIAWTVFTTMFALVPDRAMEMLERVLKIQFVTFLGLLVLYRKEHLIAAVWVIALSIGFYAVKGGLFTLATLGSFRVWGPAESFISDNNALALATVMSIPLWAFLFIHHQNRWLRVAIGLCVALSAVSALGSHSRGALLAILAMSLLLWAKSRKKAALGLLLVVFGVVAVAFMPEEWEARMRTIQTYEEDASAQGRLQAWTMLANLALDRPWLGGGFQPYQAWIYEKYNPDYTIALSAHSIYFQVLGEHGFAGLALFLGFWALAWRTCSRLERTSSGEPDLRWAYWLSRMTKVSLAGYFVGGTFLNLAYWDMPYYLFLLAAVAYASVAGARTSAREPNSAYRPVASGRPAS